MECSEVCGACGAVWCAVQCDVQYSVMCSGVWCAVQCYVQCTLNRCIWMSWLCSTLEAYCRSLCPMNTMSKEIQRARLLYTVFSVINSDLFILFLWLNHVLSLKKICGHFACILLYACNGSVVSDTQCDVIKLTACNNDMNNYTVNLNHLLW